MSESLDIKLDALIGTSHAMLDIQEAQNTVLAEIHEAVTEDAPESPIGMILAKLVSKIDAANEKLDAIVNELAERKAAA